MPRYVISDDLHPHGDTIILIGINTKLQAEANDARSDDTSWLKVAVGHWVNVSIQKSGKPTNGASNWLKPKTWEGRGINNNVTGRLLCPIDYNWDNPTYVTCLFLPPSHHGLIVSVYVPSSGMPSQDLTLHQTSFSGVCTWVSVEILLLLRSAFCRALTVAQKTVPMFCHFGKTDLA
jgi:hypothetical protein